MNHDSMIAACAPAEPTGEGESQGPDNWRVIFTGPKVEKGLVTKIVYEPGELSELRDEWD